MLKKLPLLAVLALWAGSCYSDSISPYYGSTSNAASGGALSWSMDNILPDPPGLDINSVIYNYTIQKQVDDRVTVHVQNENANGTGYIFRSTDDWMPGSLAGTQINKVIGVGNIHRDLWGDGSIEVEGPGSVTDPSVVYTYKVDPCYNPQFDPNCPGYEMPEIPVTDIDIYDPFADSNVNLDQTVDEELIEKEDNEMSEEELAEREAEEKKDSKERLEKALAAVDNSALFATAFAQSQMLATMNAAVNMNSYVAATIDGGTYQESVALDGGTLPDNSKGRRMNMSSQILHKKMVDEQYK